MFKEFLLDATRIHFMLLVFQFCVNCIICEVFNDTLYQTRCVRLTYVLFNVMASHLILKRCEIILHYRFAQLHDGVDLYSCTLCVCVVCI